MASTERDLIAERVRLLESNIATVRAAKDCQLYEFNKVVPDTPEVNSTRNEGQLRPAPAVPPQRRRQRPETSASAAADLRAVSLSPPHTNRAPSNTQALDLKTFGVSLQNSGHAAEIETERCEKVCDVSRQNQSTPLWARIKDNFSSLASRFEKASIPLRRKFKPVPCLVLLVWIVIFTVYKRNYGKEEASSRVDLDEYFLGLNYSCDKLLVYQGETLSAISRGGMQNDKCIVIERRKKTISTEKSDLGVVLSNEHRTFPGSLLLANQRLMDNSPDMLAINRDPLTYTVNLPGITDGSFTIVPSFSKYQSAVNKVLSTWFEKCNEDFSTTANFQSIESFAYSKALLRVKFGLDFIDSVIESNIDFSAMGKGEKVIKIYKFTQVFYTVSVEPTKKPSDLFHPDVTLSEITRKIDENHRPVLVDSVSYGRNIYVKVESKTIENQFELNLPILESKNGFKNGKDLEDLQTQVYVIGGHLNHTELIDVKDTSEIRYIIKKFSKLSRYNLGFPVSYSSQFIDDNSKAVVHLSTDFVESIRHSNCQKAIIKLIQEVTFVKWEVTWTEISYSEDGNRIEKRAGWNKNCKVMKWRFVSEDIEIPGYVEDLAVVAAEWTLMDSWRTAINRSNIPLIPKREFYVGGPFSGEAKPPILD